MLFVIFTLLVGIYIRATLGGSLLVIDNEGECLIWSNNNHGCTGYSAPFSLLHGDDCSGEIELRKPANILFTVFRTKRSEKWHTPRLFCCQRGYLWRARW